MTAQRKSGTSTNDGVSITVSVTSVSDCASLVEAVGAPGYIVRPEVGGVVICHFGTAKAKKKQRADQFRAFASSAHVRKSALIPNARVPNAGK